jgi:hypothetical protein
MQSVVALHLLFIFIEIAAMKNTYSYLLLVVIFTIVTAGSCKKEQPPCTDPICKLPPITQEGKNTFGCLVDGQAWTANTIDAFGLKKIYAGFPVINGVVYLNINANRRYKKEGINSDIDIYVANATGLGTYTLNYDNAIGYPATRPSNSVASYKITDNFTFPYQTDSLNTGQLTITKYDVVNGIYAGTFQFTAQNINDGSLIHITDGRFDLKLP